MALPDYLKIEPGTAIIWGTPSGSGVTNDLTFNNLADQAARMGVSQDFGAQFDEEYLVLLIIETGTAPTAGNTVELYFASTDNTARWPGKVNGTDAAYASGAVAATKRQLGPPVNVLIATADTNTTLIQNSVIWRPPCRHNAPVIVNLLGQAIRNQGVPADNTSRIIAVPRRSLIQDGA